MKIKYNKIGKKKNLKLFWTFQKQNNFFSVNDLSRGGNQLSECIVLND